MVFWSKFEKTTYKNNQFKAQIIYNGLNETEIDRVDWIEIV